MMLGSQRIMKWVLTFEDQETPQGRKPIGEIKLTDLWSRIRLAFGGMSLSEAAMLSRHSKGMAVAPFFGRPNKPEEKIDSLHSFFGRFGFPRPNHLRVRACPSHINRTFAIVSVASATVAPPN